MRQGLSRRALMAGGLSLAASPALAAVPALRALAAEKGIIFGAAIEPEAVDRDFGYETLLRRQCAALTPENVMKWNALRPARDRFDFSRADRFMAIAHDQGAQVHGHCLVWHEALPDWMGGDLTPRDGRALLTEHITRVVGRYAGHIQAWDVLNEPVERNDRRPDGLRLSPWFKALGPDYIPLAFQTAHAADPAATLVLSDYGLEYDDESWMVEKRGTMLDLLRRLKDARVPVHALALQGHLIGGRPRAFGAGLRRFLAEVAALGLEIHITELDVDDRKITGTLERRDGVVAEIYRTFLDTVLDEPAVTRVTTWGLSDRYTSKAGMFPRPDGQGVRPLPFDSELRPKIVVQALMDAFAGAPKRRLRR
jgi:endo-1,4-beta-xylanase